jgi:hypothetical protein
MCPVSWQLDVVLTVNATLVQGAAGGMALLVFSGLAAGGGVLVLSRSGFLMALGLVHDVLGDFGARGEVQACSTPVAAQGGQLVLGGMRNRWDGGRKAGDGCVALARLRFGILVSGCVE